MEIRTSRFSRGAIKIIAELTQRRFPTESHESAWVNYERYLEVRTVVYMTAKNISFLLWMFLGMEHFQISGKFSHGLEIKYAKMLYILLQVLRIVASIGYALMPSKYKFTFKVTFYLELGVTIAASFMPVEVPLEREAMY